jgi:drug/metabolite transporter (DMT)-like permease
LKHHGFLTTDYTDEHGFSTDFNPMNPKIVAGLVFTLIAALLALIAFGPPEIGGLPIRKQLAVLVLLAVVLFERYWRRRMQPLEPTAASGCGNSNLKTLYLTLAAVTAASSIYLSDFRWSGAAVLIATCLMAAFFSREMIEDERVQHLKLKSLRVALILAAFAVFGHALLLKLSSGNRTGLRYLSAFDLIIITMLLALGLYHYWRWQDGREGGDQKPDTVNH